MRSHGWKEDESAKKWLRPLLQAIIVKGGLLQRSFSATPHPKGSILLRSAPWEGREYPRSGNGCGAAGGRDSAMLIAYKAFSKDLTCRGMKYKAAQWHTFQRAQTAEAGLHCAVNPLDILTYYPNPDDRRIFEVLVDGDIDEDGRDSKVAATRVYLKKELDTESFVLHAVRYILTHPRMPLGGAVCTKGGVYDTKPRNGFVIVCSEDPWCIAPEGTVVALVKRINGEVVSVNVFTVGKDSFLPGKRYTA